jgi:hypothetical protein
VNVNVNNHIGDNKYENNRNNSETEDEVKTIENENKKEHKQPLK